MEELNESLNEQGKKDNYNTVNINRIILKGM